MKENEANGDPKMSALAEHAMNHQHDIAWEDATFVGTKPRMSVQTPNT